MVFSEIVFQIRLRKVLGAYELWLVAWRDRRSCGRGAYVRLYGELRKRFKAKYLETFDGEVWEWGLIFVKKYSTEELDFLSEEDVKAVKEWLSDSPSERGG